MLRSPLVVALALGLFAAPALAQTPPNPPPRQERPARDAAMSAADYAALLDARIASLKAGLRLSPDQEKNWPAVEAALRDNAREREARIDRFRRTRSPDADAATRLRRAAEVFSARAAEMNRLADAVDPLSKSLDASQRRRLAMLMREAEGERRR